jgi:hypothetical protein
LVGPNATLLESPMSVEPADDLARDAGSDVRPRTAEPCEVRVDVICEVAGFPRWDLK